ncbi:predicted protein [Naegleria gruberi]|uniref:Predicted protein n=1 Tax=Naegleria gruberi TaxID=5762 RepID=D2VFC5_NAEGR|nr:uncharacterized protein NAEGRDRAFT_79740 [Naegleria gruberi]EFC44346.1 predicted protein [Naegleria gruberi]|eukprot:XP_002677090.1 predicted protein [Naegleria gruberi strain NEG-M]
MGQSQLSRDSQNNQSDNDYYQPNNNTNNNNNPEQQDDNVSITSDNSQQQQHDDNIKQINRLYGWSMIESMNSSHHSLTPRNNNNNTTRLRYLQNNNQQQQQQQFPPTTTTTTSKNQTSPRFGAKKQSHSSDNLEAGKEKERRGVGSVYDGISGVEFDSVEEQERQRELEELLASSASTTSSILNENDITMMNNNNNLNNDNSNNNRVRRSMAIHTGKHYSISLGNAIHERLQKELKNHDEAQNNEKGFSAPIGNENSIDNYYRERSAERGSTRMHHRRSSSIDSNISNMINNEMLSVNNQITTLSPPNQPSELIAGSLVHEMTFIEEELDPVEKASWNEKHRDIAELWNSIPKSYHAGINRVYNKLKIRFKNDIDVSDYQIRQMAIDLGFPNFLYEYMFSKLERTVFSLLHDEYILKKKKNKNRRNLPKRPSSSATKNEYITTKNVTPDIPNVTAVLQSHVVEFKTLPSSPALPRTELLNRLFNDEDVHRQEPNRLLSSFDEYININQDMVFEKGLKIKLIITEVGKSPGRIRTAASPIISRLKVFDQFGWFHTSFSIGNLRFDWTNSGYCAVTTVKSATSLLAITVKEISTLRELESIIKLLSIEISRWNRNFSYTNLKGNISKETGSCQTFTVEMMKIMGVSDLSFAGNNSIHNFLQDLLTKGDPITKFSMNEEFKKKYTDLIDTKIEQCKAVTVVSSRELLLAQNSVAESSTTSDEDVLGQAFAQQQQAHFEIKKQQSAKVKRWEHFKSQYFTSNKKHIIFNSHRELDYFVLYLKELDEKFNETQECGLLNAFDRGYWLRYSSAVSVMQRIQQRKKQRENARSKLGFSDPLKLSKEEQEEYIRVKRDLEICQPLIEDDQFKCAFGDPSQSRSLFIANTKREDVLTIQKDLQVGSLKL